MSTKQSDTDKQASKSNKISAVSWAVIIGVPTLSILAVAVLGVVLLLTRRRRMSPKQMAAHLDDLVGDRFEFTEF